MKWMIVAISLLMTGCAALEATDDYLMEIDRKYFGGSESEAVATVGQHLILASECIGAVVNGVCHGTEVDPIHWTAWRRS